MKYILLSFLISVTLLSIPKKANNIIMFKIFTNFNLSKDSNKILTTSLESNLTELGYGIISDKIQEEALKEQRDQHKNDCYDDECLVDTGKMLAAKKILIINIDKHKNSYFIKIKKIDIETAILENTNAMSYKGSFSDYEKVNLILSKLLKKIFIKKKVILKKGKNSLYITTIPEGAKVELDNNFLGYTPLRTSIADGDYNFKISKRNYNSLEFDKHVYTNVNIKEKLRSKTYKITILTEPKGASVYSCYFDIYSKRIRRYQRVLGKTPYDTDINTEDKCFQFYKFGYFLETQHIKYNDRDRRLFNLRKKKTYNISFDIDSGYNIQYKDSDDAYNNNWMVGKKEMTIPEGNYSFRFKKPNYRIVRKNLTIKSDMKNIKIKSSKEVLYIGTMELLTEFSKIIGIGEKIDSYASIGTTFNFLTFVADDIKMDMFKFGYLQSFTNNYKTVRFSFINAEFTPDKKLYLSINLVSLMGELDFIIIDKYTAWSPLGIKIGYKIDFGKYFSLKLYSKLDWMTMSVNKVSDNGYRVSTGLSFEYKFGNTTIQ